MQLLDIFAAVVLALAVIATVTGLAHRAPVAAEQAASAGVALALSLAYLALLGSDVALYATAGMPLVAHVWVRAERAALLHLRRVADWGCSAALRGDYVRACRQARRLHLDGILDCAERV